jgi:hypothetical protein
MQSAIVLALCLTSASDQDNFIRQEMFLPIKWSDFEKSLVFKSFRPACMEGESGYNDFLAFKCPHLRM